MATPNYQGKAWNRGWIVSGKTGVNAKHCSFKFVSVTLYQVYPCLCPHLSLKNWTCWMAEIMPVFCYVVSSVQFCFGSQNHTRCSQNICVTQALGKSFLYLCTHTNTHQHRHKGGSSQMKKYLCHCYTHPAGIRKQEVSPEAEPSWAEVGKHRWTHLSPGWARLKTGAI